MCIYIYIHGLCIWIDLGQYQGGIVFVWLLCMLFLLKISTYIDCSRHVWIYVIHIGCIEHRAVGGESRT